MEVMMIRYDGAGPRPEADLEKIRASAGVTVVNDTFPKTVIVRVDGDLAKQRLRRIDGWTLHASQTGKVDLYPAPQFLTAPRLRVVPKSEKPD